MRLRMFRTGADPTSSVRMPWSIHGGGHIIIAPLVVMATSISSRLAATTRRAAKARIGTSRAGDRFKVSAWRCRPTGIHPDQVRGRPSPEHALGRAHTEFQFGDQRGPRAAIPWRETDIHGDGARQR